MWITDVLQSRGKILALSPMADPEKEITSCISLGAGLN